MTDEMILTLHPQGKSGKRISRATYDLFKKTIEAELKGHELTHADLFERLNRRLKGKFDGNISWYAETVKLDLEARNVLERTSTKPVTYRLKK